MERQYERVPLAVDAVFTTSGEFRPRQLIYKGEHFDISRIIGVRRYCPCVVGCVAPIEYTVVVQGIEIRYTTSTIQIGGSRCVR